MWWIVGIIIIVILIIWLCPTALELLAGIADVISDIDFGD